MTISNVSSLLRNKNLMSSGWSIGCFLNIPNWRYGKVICFLIKIMQLTPEIYSRVISN